jgi:hypothetical protein
MWGHCEPKTKRTNEYIEQWIEEKEKGELITLPVSRVLVRTRTTSSWWATSLTCLGRLIQNWGIHGKKLVRREIEIEIELTIIEWFVSYYFSTHGWVLWMIGAILSWFYSSHSQTDTNMTQFIEIFVLLNKD